MPSGNKTNDDVNSGNIHVPLDSIYVLLHEFIPY